MTPVAGDGTGALPPLVPPVPSLTAEERARYSRHLLLEAVGDEGQRRLRAASVFVVGAGGLGAPVLMYLAAAGVGRITVIDDDEIDQGNLHRQVIHSVPAIGRPKVESARERLAELAPGVRVEAVHARLDALNIDALLEGHHLVVDGSDNFSTRYLVSDACEIAGIPVVWGTIDRFRAQLAVFWSRPPTPADPVTLRDLYPAPPPPGSVPSCAEAGVVGALCGTVGSMMAMEAVKLITGSGRPLLGRLVLMDLLETTHRTVTIRPDPSRTPVTCLPDGGVESCEVRSPDAQVVPTVSATALAAELAGAGSSGAVAPVLVDVRGAGERSIAAIDPSVWVPLDTVAEVASDPTGALGRAAARGPLVVYCKSGVRSARAAATLTGAGFAGVRSLEGGIEAWTRDVDPSLPGY
ncbi:MULTISPECIES: ThiF family adenylyltransferase [unclassified Dietzia]|uniref:ThiF family adenylyltransferase n=1 Tax=unclassified Dietzia TaxID=2617939 RepID=UPI001318124E|nr:MULTISPECIES: ThiF family adenylyltransferase [unclassified Dietzia]QGW24016.1 UBA/THIF-type NAD/FAD binding protein [Dietzia sp. DQ12-45-1b]